MKTTIYDYVDLRGDLSPIDFPYNEIDYLIFSELAYVDFDQIIDFQYHSITLKQAFDMFQEKNPEIQSDSNISYIKSFILFEKMARSPRYQNIQFISYSHELDKDLIKQFAAITLLLEDQRLFIAYRGTDDSLIGWHEDFMMLCNDIVPAQTSSLHYLEYISEFPYKCTLLESLQNKYLAPTLFERLKKHFLYKKKRPLLLGGHSKGGNLAMYAGCFCQKDIKDRISYIYNYDGPGFHEDIIDSINYQEMLPRIQSYIPNYSFFGIVLGHEEQYQVVHSHYTGMAQHDGFSWEVGPYHFTNDELSYESVQFAIKVILFLEKLSDDDKRIFVDTMFHLFDSLDLLTFTDLSHISYKQILAAIKELTLIEPHVRKMLIEVLHMLWLEAKKIKMD